MEDNFGVERRESADHIVLMIGFGKKAPCEVFYVGSGIFLRRLYLI